METAITITISLCDAREANDRIYDNRWLTSQLQHTSNAFSVQQPTNGRAKDSTMRMRTKQTTSTN